MRKLKYPAQKGTQLLKQPRPKQLRITPMPRTGAYLETENTDKTADVFLHLPFRIRAALMMPATCPLSDADTKESFVGAINMEKGIYDADSRFFAPYYRQIGLNVYDMPEADREPYLETAYADVRDAFLYYMDNYNEGPAHRACRIFPGR